MHLFVSHSRANSSAAFRLSEELRQLNIETWLDVRDVEPGADWDQAVASAVRQAAGFVFVIGPPGPSDRWQTYEWQQVVDGEYHLDQSKPLVPVLIGNPDLPGFLKTRHPLLLTDTPESFHQVAQAIGTMLQNPADSIDPIKLELGLKARTQALASFREYSQSLAEEEIKRVSVRAVE